MAEQALTASSPDWTSISDEVLCPLCEYNLRGLSEPRCPECGYHFEWPEVLDPRRRNHPYLFEHHPERNFKSFWQTASGACRPHRFWTSLHPVQRSRVGRLLLYWFLGAFCLLLVCPAPIIALASVVANTVNTGRYWMYIKPGGSTVTTLDILEDMLVSQRWKYYYSALIGPLMLLIPLIWPWLTFLALMIFQISMRRARVKPIHVLRCTLYSFDLVPFCGLVVIGSVALGFFLDDEQWFFLCLPLVLAISVLGGTWRIGISYARYLRFDHPFTTVILTQTIVTLFVLALLFIFDTRLTDYYVVKLSNWMYWR